eukprot:3144152-Amphidinium_carterae.1
MQGTTQPACVRASLSQQEQQPPVLGLHHCKYQYVWLLETGLHAACRVKFADSFDSVLLALTFRLQHGAINMSFEISP